MQQLPEDFISLMRENYGESDAVALCDALLTTEPEVSVRLNRRKISAICETHPNPPCEGGGVQPCRYLPSVHADRYFRFSGKKGFT